MYNALVDTTLYCTNKWIDTCVFNVHFFLALLLHVFGHFLFYKFKKKTEARVILPYI